jgi:hypothetical protein
MGTINLKITARDTSEVLAILSWIAEEIADQKITTIKDYTISGINCIEEQEEEEFCYPDCPEDQKRCVCFQEIRGCDEYHRKKEDELI